LKWQIPVAKPDIGNDEIEAVTEVLKSGWITQGENVLKFENKFSKFCMAKYGIATSSGTSALHAALAVCGVSKGDNVITTPLSCIASSNPILLQGALPIFIDTDKRTFNIDVDLIKSKITNKTKAILVVHLFGHPVDMDPLMELAEKYDLKVIEDAAQAMGAMYKGKRAGSIGHISCFSLYANKIITTGEGGMVVFKNIEVANKARILRDHGMSKSKSYWHKYAGFNFRMTNMQAALGLAQSERIQETVNWKRRMGQRYTERLSDIKAIQLPIERSWSRQVYWMYGILLNKSHNMTARALADKLSDLGIQTRPFFLGMHAQPALQNLGLFQSEDYPVADYLSENGLYLPSGLALSEQQMDEVCAALHTILT